MAQRTFYLTADPAIFVAGGSPDASSLYDVSPLRGTLEHFVDFGPDQQAGGQAECRHRQGTGNFLYLDHTARRRSPSRSTLKRLGSRAVNVSFATRKFITPAARALPLIVPFAWSACAMPCGNPSRTFRRGYPRKFSSAASKEGSLSISAGTDDFSHQLQRIKTKVDLDGVA